MLKRWQWVKMTMWFWSSFLIGKRSLCCFQENLVLRSLFIFDLGHDDDSVWHVQHFKFLGLIFVAGTIPLDLDKKSGQDRGKNLIFDMFNVHLSWCGQYVAKIQHVLAQPSRDCAIRIALVVARRSF